MNITKNLVTISLLIFVIAVIGILSVAVFSENKTTTSQPAQQNNNTAVSSATAKAFTVAEVAKHDSANDCWTIISGKVYDVTKLIPIHTGGPNTIISSCGKDSTKAFNTRDGMGPHSQQAKAALNTYYVGTVN